MATRFNFKKMVGFFSIICWLCLCSASFGDNSSESTDSIIRKAAQAANTIKSFSADVVVSSFNGQSSTGLFFQVATPDGLINSRTEMQGADKFGAINHIVNIKNGEGSWILQKGVAFKMDFLQSQLGSANQSIASLPAFSGDNVKRTVEETVFNGIPCYLVTESMDSTLVNSISELLANGPLKEVSKTSKIDPNTLIPVKKEYYIGKGDFFVYSTQSFNKNDIKISELSFKNVKQNPVLTGDLFEIPKSSRIIIARSPQEYMEGVLAMKGGHYTPPISSDPPRNVRYIVLFLVIISTLFPAYFIYREFFAKNTE